MFEKFDEIRVIARREGSLAHKPDLLAAISHLPYPDQAELKGIVLFGRDFLPSGNKDPLKTLEGYIRDSERGWDWSYAGYLSDKPIAHYMDEAERKLRGDWIYCDDERITRLSRLEPFQS